MDKSIMCIECGSTKEFEMKKTIRQYKGEGYNFELTVRIPYCSQCGAPLYEEEVEEEIAKIANAKIREQRDIITVEEILKLLDKYNISQKFLSKLLGWGEITLTRYISGNYTPNKTNSDRLKTLTNPYIFLNLLNDFCQKSDEKIYEEKSYIKAQKRIIEELEEIECTKGKIFSVVNWFLAHSSEDTPITHLALQKLLYFVQSWSIVLTEKWIFGDECQAWAHGAVYPQVYEMFKEFKYAPLPRVHGKKEFEKAELEVLYAVKKYYFDVYSGRTLENICHYEEPYISARKGYIDGSRCQEIISKKNIEIYYREIAKLYDIKLENISKIKNYISAVLN